MSIPIQLIRELRNFDRSVWMFLTSTAINGLLMSIRALIFNFYILSLGYDLEFLGLANALAPASALLLGIPLGVLLTRIGERRAMALGLGLTGLGIAGQVITLHPAFILVSGFIMGSGNLLFTLSQAPYIIRMTRSDLRIKLLSANFGLFMLAALVGNILGGQMPVWIEAGAGFPLRSSPNYQFVLLIAAALAWGAIVPLLFIADNRQKLAHMVHLTSLPWELLRRPFVQRLFFIEFLVGIGASVLLPYMNLFFAARFSYSERIIGLILGVSSLITGLASFGAPRMLQFYKYRIHAMVTNQSISYIFLIILSITPVGWVAVLCYWLRDLFMKTVSPLLDSFSLEYISENERGMMSSIVRFGFTCGSAFGPYISGWIQNRAGFSPLFYVMLFCYGVGTLLFGIFFWNFEKQNELGTSSSNRIESVNK